jgi:hypothetical protein
MGLNSDEERKRFMFPCMALKTLHSERNIRTKGMMGYPLHPLYTFFLAFLTCVQTKRPLEMNFVCVDGFFKKLFVGQPNFGFIFKIVLFNKAMLGFSVSWSWLNVA